jgi:two-component system, LytTR family, response regulator
MTPMRTVIIDDEPTSRKVLSSVLTMYCPEVITMGEADSVSGGCELISATKPELIFLDVEIKDGTGFDILQQFPNRTFDTVFVSAYSHYSLKAIKHSAFDFLVKPVDAADLTNTVKRVNQARLVQSGTISGSVDLSENCEALRLRKIALPDSDGLEYVALDDILFIKADGSYTEVHLLGGEKRILSKNLREFNDKLGREGFYRVHNSYLINTAHIKKYLRCDGGVVVMSNQERVPVSRSNYDGFKEFLKTLSIRL